MNKKKPLSHREQEVLQLIAKGNTSEQIGQTLGITRLTAQTHRRNMLRKLKLNNSQQLIGWGYQRRLLK